MVIYLDNAATTWPKPPETLKAFADFYKNIGANPGRSAHSLSMKAAKTVYNGRKRLAEFFNIKNPSRLVFTKNATEAINLALFGILETGDEVVTSSLEHNSVMRPLRYLEKHHDVKIKIIDSNEKGTLSPKDFTKVVSPETRLAVVTHASNVIGNITPIKKIKEVIGSTLLLVDGAQTAGAVPVDFEDCRVDLYAFSGHKSLYGLMGTGGLYVRESVSLKPLIFGGTGSQSEYEAQPDFFPDAMEGGTPNVAGIAALEAGIKFIQSQGLDCITGHCRKLLGMLITELDKINRITLYGGLDLSTKTAALSLNIENWPSSKVSNILDRDYGICTRPGLHCAPATHKNLGTFPEGTVRLALSFFNTEEEIRATTKALRQIAGK